MKILNLKAENIKRLVAIDISPTKNMVEITGKNGQGKTSILDAIWWCLAGTKNITSKPIREGEEEGYVTCDLGEIIITRKFKTGKNGQTSSLTVVSKDGSKFASPQAVIDKLMGDFTFDPLKFARMDARQQFESLRKFVPDVDFDKIEADNKADYEERKNVNRQQKEKKVSADAIIIKSEPSEKIDESELMKEFKAATEHNSNTEIRKSNRKNLFTKIEENKNKIAELEKENEDISSKIENAGELPKLIDITDIESNMVNAKNINDAFDDLQHKKSLMNESNELLKQSEKLTQSIEKRNEDKQKAIESADLPVEGITFGDGEVILNGQPFDQASDAEQLKASLSIAMALNPDFKVIRVRDGSLLDEDSMKVLEKMADDNDFQIWIERVDGSGKVGFVIEEGQLKTEPELEEY